MTPCQLANYSWKVVGKLEQDRLKTTRKKVFELPLQLPASFLLGGVRSPPITPSYLAQGQAGRKARPAPVGVAKPPPVVGSL